MDVAMQPGRDFRKVIHQSLDSCGVFLALIGKGWLTAIDGAGGRRLDDATDFVRIETAAALKRDIVVIPVLVQGAQTPKEGQLPEELKDLAYRNAIELTHARWDSDLQLLIKALRPYVSEPSVKAQPAALQPVDKGKSAKTWLWVAVALVVAAGMMIWLSNRQKEVSPPVTEAVGTVGTMQSSGNAPPPVYANAPAKKPMPRTPAISLAAEGTPLPNNPARFTYTVWVKASDDVVQDISRVHYDFVLESNPLSIEGSSAPPFSALYEGYGCYPVVEVTVIFKSSGSPFKKTFNMCNAMKGAKKE